VLLLAWVKDQPGEHHARESIRDNWHVLSPGFKRFLVPAGLFALAYFSLGFVLLKAHAVGFTAPQIVLLYALFNATCVLVAPVAGMLGDRVGRGRVVVLGYALYGVICLWLAFASSPWQIVVAFALYGFFYAIEDSQSKAMIADLEQGRRATAIGVYNAVTGVLYLPASLMAGALWAIAPAYAFGLAAILSLLTILVFIAMRPDRQLLDTRT
jgi:MFS family permease